MAVKNPFILSQQKSKSLNTASAQTKSIQSSVGNEASTEAKFKYAAAQGDVILGGNDKNAYIILNKDRPSSKISGHGGIGDTQSSTIDIVVGRLSSVANVNDEVLYVDNNMMLDAARIYISQKTDVDVNFGLTDGQVGNAKNKSAIALKADGLRFIAREGIKFITKTDANNSTGIEVSQHSGIDLIANNDDTNLQPMLLGVNTVQLMDELITEIDKLSNRIEHFIDEQQKFNNAVATHTHYSPFFGKPTTISPDLAVKNGQLIFRKLLNTDIGFYFQKVNFLNLISKYLSPSSASSITSKYNRVN